MSAPRRAAVAAAAVALTSLLAACGGGFASAPAAPPDQTIRSYVALGDDFTAAPGVGDEVGEDHCERSDANYPALLAQDLGIHDVRDVSCVGATTTSLTSETTPAKDDAPVPAQLDAVGKDTGLVTIGAGIEDRSLLPRVFRICVAFPCGDKPTPQALLDDASAMAASLAAAVRRVQDEAPDAYVVLIGYPRITPDSGSCDAMPDIDQPALDAANRVLAEINREIRSAARETGVGYLDVERLSTGHELCSGEPWIGSNKDKRGQATYLPVAAEQSAVGKALAELVRNR